MTTRRRTCTARCWAAKGPKCRCICEGQAHGRPSFNVPSGWRAEKDSGVVFTGKTPIADVLIATDTGRED